MSPGKRGGKYVSVPPFRIFRKIKIEGRKKEKICTEY
jgi:hypothetical protein